MKRNILAFALLVTLAISLSAQTFNANNSILGTVVSWGEQVIPYVAPGTRFTKIAAGNASSLALKSDGTVVAWGDNAPGESAVPTGLTGVVAIAAGGGSSLALKSDGTVVAWGYNYSDISHMVSCPRPAWAFFVIFVLLHRFARTFYPVRSGCSLAQGCFDAFLARNAPFLLDAKTPLPCLSLFSCDC